MANKQFNQLETQQRLGFSYTSYRLLLSLGLFAILLFLQHDLMLSTHYPILYTTISSIYLGMCIINFLTFKFYQKHVQLQLFVYLMLDMIHITLILFLSFAPNIAIILLYIVVVLAATMLLTPRKALFLTLASIIAVVYQQFFYSIFDGTKVLFIGSSALITLVFISTYALGQIASKRMKFVETLAVDQRKEIIQLQYIHQSIIEQLDTGFMVIDRDGKIITYNETARTLLNLPTEISLQQQNFRHIQEQLFLELEQHRKHTLRGIFHYFTAPDTTGLSVQYRPIATQQQQFTLLIFENLQKVNQHVQQLKLASLGQLSASIAHEIRNPLAAISQANELLAADQLEHQQIFTKMIQKQCLRINRIIEDTLNMSRQHQTMPEDVMLYTWLHEMANEDLADVKPFLYLDIEYNTCISFDPQQLRQVLINLVRNAIRHGHEHIPNSLVHLRVQQFGETLHIDVIDQGLGISEQQQHKLFEPFHSTASHGTGLGLYLSRTLCEANHARLKYIPQTQGACFRIECLLRNNSALNI
ncbi:MAG: HAMP domain-containing histidine kinase [Acinetobacter sp.]|jgi:two-component system sensor histidine kinase PilS (NtrC family)|nr:MAG: HAMP domain-containing histidine kinase [Acinetobacter sp.]